MSYFLPFGGPAIAVPKSKDEVKTSSGVSSASATLPVADQAAIDDVKSTTVSIPVSAAVKRAMGKKTSSQKKRGAKGDGLVFTIDSLPARIFKPIGNSNQIFTVPQEVFLRSWLTTSNAVSTFAGLAFTVGSLDQIGSLTALFDQYRIALVECWINPQLGPIQTPGNEFASVIDYDDNTALTTFPQALDYVNCVASNGSCAHFRKFVPHAAVAMYSGTFTSFGNETAPWCDAASTGIQHYGLKVASTLGATAITYDLMYRLTTQWRNTR